MYIIIDGSSMRTEPEQNQKSNRDSNDEKSSLQIE